MNNNKRYTETFKKSVVQQYIDGKTKAELIREYRMAPKTLDAWIKKYSPQLFSKEKLYKVQIKEHEDTIKLLEKKIEILEEEIEHLNKKVELRNESFINQIKMKK